MVQAIDGCLYLGISNLFKVSAFGEILPQQPVCVFVQPPFPGMVGVSKIDRHLEFFRHVFMAGKFLAVVEGHRVALPLVRAKQGYCCRSYSLGMLLVGNMLARLNRDALSIRVSNAPF